MKNKTQSEAINDALDLLVDNNLDLSNALEKDGLIKQLSKAILERSLKAEMDNHLGYDKYNRSNLENSRNGTFQKKLITENGKIELNIPRDRQGKFEPAIVKKKQTRIAGLDDKIISLYAKGMTLSDIKIQLKELYDADISESLISKITDDIFDEVKSWQNRAVESVYPIVFFDCLVVKVRKDRSIINKSVYIALGINVSGLKEVLGLWISDNEGAKFWLNNLTEMKNRGLKDILISCTDNLVGMSDAISAVYPKCEHQLCIVHQIRNSLKFVSYKDRKELITDLKLIYQAHTEDAAVLALDDFAKKWNKKYPQIAKSWYNNWENLVIFLQYPQAIRKVIYTTNSIESLNNCLRKVTKNKRVFPTDESVFKTLYLTINYITSKWTMPISNWNEAMAHFLVKFEDRISIND